MVLDNETRLRMLRQTDERAKKQRFVRRKTIDSLLRLILNLDILDMFSKGKDKIMMPLPNNFPEGHQQYLKHWEKLFLYEMYNLIINSRRTTEDKKAGIFESVQR